MAPDARLFANVSCALSRSAPGSEPTIVWLRGDQDLATLVELSSTIDEAIAHDRGTLVVDLSDVRFISAATVGVLVRAGEALSLDARPLSLRSPSPCVARIFAVCGLTGLLDSGREDGSSPLAPEPALASWVAVPPTFRVVAGVDPAVTTPHLASDLVMALGEASTTGESVENVVGPGGT